MSIVGILDQNSLLRPVWIHHGNGVPLLPAATLIDDIRSVPVRSGAALVDSLTPRVIRIFEALVRQSEVSVNI